jgi:hypothetical protein
MANANSVAGFAQSGTGRNQFPTQTVATLTETVLQISTDSGTNANYFLVAPTGGQIYGAVASLDVNSNQAVIDRSPYMWGLPSGDSNDQFSSSSWDGRPFKVRISGIGNAGANAGQTLIVNLYQGTSSTLGSDKAIATTGSAFAAAAGGAFNFTVEASLLWDVTSGILSGSYTSNIAFGTVSQIVAPTAVTNVVTGLTTLANLSFLASLKLGNAASSTITVREFVLDRV